MKNSKSIAFLMFGLLTGSSALMAQHAEDLLGVKPNSTGIDFQVTSGGCTSKADFSTNVKKGNPMKVSLFRNKSDNCEAYIPHGTTINFTYKELGLPPGASFVIVNTSTYKVPTVGEE